MNRYVIDGMIADARRGQRVLFVGENGYIAREAFQQVTDRATQLIDMEALQIRRTKGQERLLVANGGGIRFITYRNHSAFRGLLFGVVFLHGLDMSPEDYLPTGAEIIRA